MFAIIMPVALGPAIAVLIYLDRQAKKHGLVNMASSNAARRAAVDSFAEKQDITSPRGLIVAAAPHTDVQESWGKALLRNWYEIDAFGLILLGFGWSLLLLPFSLKTYATHGWQNHSMIAMMVVGGVLLIAYVVYEIKWAKMPSAPRRLVFNKTFVMSIIIDSFYFCGFFSPFRIYSMAVRCHANYYFANVKLSSRWSNAWTVLELVRARG